MSGAAVRERVRSTEPTPSSARSRWWVIALVLLGVAALVGVAVWAVWFSSLLAVQKVIVQGATELPAQRIVAVADVAVGTPLARVDDEAVAQRLQAIPRVASVEVRRGFPHELVLVVTDRVPVAVVPAGQVWMAVDADGVEFEKVSHRGTVPVVQAEPGPARREALATVVSLPRPLLAQVESVSATTASDVRLLLRSGEWVRWGDASRAERKAQVLSALQRREAAGYDVSAPDLPTTIG